MQREKGEFIIDRGLAESKAQRSGKAQLMWPRVARVEGNKIGASATEESLECQSESFTFLQEKTSSQD